jgi:hypothetical protein
MKYSISAALILSSLILTGCFQVSQTKLGNDSESSSKEPTISKTDYALISVPTIESILVNILQVPATDISVQKLRSNAVALGAGDQTQGLPVDSSFSPLKGKVLSEIFIDGCSLGLQNPAVKAKLFPKGNRDYDALYLTFLGRKPSDEEVEILNALNSSVSDQVAPAATCGAVLASIEPLNRT